MKKSNEITAIPKLLKMPELSGCIVTIDAMGTQKEIAKADYILSVKENQSRLYEDISLFFQPRPLIVIMLKLQKNRMAEQKQENVQWLEQRKEWCGISGIGMIVSNIEIIGQMQYEKAVHYVIYSELNMTAAELLSAKRRCWSTENSLHRVLDVDFGEDNMRMRRKFAAENMDILRHLALNLLKSEKFYKGSINLKRKKCLLSHDCLLKVFAFS